MANTTYGPESDHSYFRDLMSWNVNNNQDAHLRLLRHAGEIIETPRAQRAVTHTTNRRETRAVSSALASDGVFVTPIYAVSDADVYRSYPPSAMYQATTIDDPGYGLTLNVPLIENEVTSVAVQADNTGVVDTGGTLETEYVSANLETISGEVTVSQQLYERSGPAPFSTDMILQRALQDSFRAAVDSYVMATMVSAGGTVNGAASFTAADFFQDVANAEQAVMTGAGVRLPATHSFTTPTLLQWLLSQSDTSGRPLLTPWIPNTPTTVKPMPSGGAAVGYSGCTLLGSHAFSDGNLADVPSTNPAQAPLVFANMGEVFLLQSEPVCRVVNTYQTSTTLSCIVQLYAYVACVVRHSSAVQSLEANYLLAQPSFA